MTRRPARNLAASVRQRLLNLARERREDFQAVLTRYALERLLYRLASSPHADEFVLKGAMLFTLWTGEAHRATWDVDFLGRGAAELPRLRAIFGAVCGIEVPDDGLVFDEDRVRAERIREDQVYEGVRVHVQARLGAARLSLQVDVGFGDAVTPPPAKLGFPTLLDFPRPVLETYPRESVVAEKLQAMVVLGIANSRMKDFYDVWSLARLFEFEGPRLCKAIAATFQRRRTSLPMEPPLAFTDAFHGDRVKQTQWNAFVRKGRLRADAPPLPEVVHALRAFLLLPLQALVTERAFDERWPPGGAWTAL